MISDNMDTGINASNTATAKPTVYIEPKVSSEIVGQLLSKLQGNHAFGEFGAIAKAIDVEDITKTVVQKLEGQMSNMTDEDMTKVMALGMQIMLQVKNKNPNISKITKDIFDVMKLLKIDMTSILFEINESIRGDEPEDGSMYDLLKGYMKRSRLVETIHFTFKQQFFGFVTNHINEIHRQYRRQFN